MEAPTHITAGRTAIRALLVAVVLTAAVAGTSGTAAAEPINGKGNDVYPLPARHSLGWMGDDAVTFGFPIDNVTVGVGHAGTDGGSGTPGGHDTGPGAPVSSGHDTRPALRARTGIDRAIPSRFPRHGAMTQ